MSSNSSDVDPPTSQYNAVKMWAGLAIAIILIGTMMAYVVYYVMYEATDEWLLEFANDMSVLIIMGVGAALVLFGLNTKKS